jgi:Reverse transcriptase-like
MKITYRASASMIPVGYVDSDFGGCIDTGQSTSGYVFLAASGPICWSSKRQQRVSTSMTEAEYKALCHAGQTAL